MKKSYDKQFKILAVKLVLEDDESVYYGAKALFIIYPLQFFIPLDK